MDQLEHYERAEEYLDVAGRVVGRSDSMVTSEHVVALVRLAEAHMKMIPLAPMSPQSRPV